MLYWRSIACCFGPASNANSGSCLPQSIVSEILTLAKKETVDKVVAESLDFFGSCLLDSIIPELLDYFIAGIKSRKFVAEYLGAVYQRATKKMDVEALFSLITVAIQYFDSLKNYGDSLNEVVNCLAFLYQANASLQAQGQSNFNKDVTQRVRSLVLNERQVVKLSEYSSLLYVRLIFQVLADLEKEDGNSTANSPPIRCV